MCIFAGNSDIIYFLGVMLLLKLEILPKWNILLKQFVSTTPLIPLVRISWNFVVMKCMKVLMDIFAGNSYSIMPLLNSATSLKPRNRIWWNFVFMIQRVDNIDSTMGTRSSYCVDVHICRNFWFIFLASNVPLNLEILPKLNLLLK